MGLAETTTGWTRRRLIQQYESENSERLPADREVLTAHGYREIQRVVDNKGRVNIQYAKAAITPERPAYGRLRETLLVPGGVNAELIAWGEGFDVGWRVGLSFDGPDDRYVAARIDLESDDVAELLKHLSTARGLLREISRGPSALYERAVGSPAGLNIGIAAKGDARWVTMAARSRTGWVWPRHLQGAHVADWIAQLEYAQRRGIELIEELQETST
jgi:hypothetical protein